MIPNNNINNQYLFPQQQTQLPQQFTNQQQQQFIPNQQQQLMYQNAQFQQQPHQQVLQYGQQQMGQPQQQLFINPQQQQQFLQQPQQQFVQQSFQPQQQPQFQPSMQPQFIFQQPQQQQQFILQQPQQFLQSQPTMLILQPQQPQQHQLIHQPPPMPSTSTSTRKSSPSSVVVKKESVNKESVNHQVPGREDICTNWLACKDTKDTNHRGSKRHMCTIKDCTKTNDKVHVARFLHQCKYGEKCRHIDDDTHNHNFIHPCKFKEKCTKLGDIMHKVFFTHPKVEGNSSNSSSSSSSTYPSSWGRVSSDDHYQCVKLSHTTQEFKAIEKKFLERINHSYPTAKVIDIERVENAKLWKAFTIKKSEVTLKNSTMKAGDQVKTLYHGAGEAAINAIVKTGFDYRLCSVGHYGKGNYFAVNASYSHGYSDAASDGKRRMLVCKVVVGESLRVSQKDQSLRRPQDLTTGKMYDSVQAGPTGTEFVVFENESPYPEYVVTYQ